MKRILILGVNGFIGHHLSKRILASTDWEVFGMDMQADRIEDVLEDPRFHFFEGDITINREWIEYHIRKCDTVLPLVAIATPATYVKEPLRVFELDFEANLPIVRACGRSSPTRAASPRARSTTSAIRGTTSRCASSRRAWSSWRSTIPSTARPRAGCASSRPPPSATTAAATRTCRTACRRSTTPCASCAGARASG